MMKKQEVIREAEFNPKIKIYIFLQGLLILMITVIGILLIPFWLVGVGQYVSKRYYKGLECRLLNNALYFKKGILVSVEKTIPLDKIQDLTFTEGPLLRKFNLSMMKIETAGGGGDESDMSLFGIIDAHEFKEAVFEQREQLQNQNPQKEGAEQQSEDMITVLKEIRDSLHRLERNSGEDD